MFAFLRPRVGTRPINVVVAGPTLSATQGRSEGVNTWAMTIKRQMCGRSSFDMLCHGIL
nr:hypothetical protein GCM10025730_18140 [Promicromonospora thailandica]